MSNVVLVHKKDRGLHFCIDLCKLNALMVKDAYTLPWINETLRCLNGACIFTSLDAKARYWQVKLNEASRTLTAFMVGPLSFCECRWMPFNLMNAPATFCHLWKATSETYISNTI